MISTKQWGEHTLRTTTINEYDDLMLLNDLAQALEMSDKELLLKMRSDFVFVHRIKDDPNIEDGTHLFLTRKGVCQALLMAETDEALNFQDFIFELVRLQFIGPASKSAFDFLDDFVSEKFRKESK